MTWVKVCGLTNHADVAAAVDAGADAIGFVNVPSSPRYLGLAEVQDLARGVPVHSILLTLDLEPTQALDAVRITGVTGIQPYGRRSAEVAAAAVAAGFVVLHPVRAEPGIELGGVPGIPLLDTPSQTTLGGTGRSFDWALAGDLTERFVLAGGLGPANVSAAVDQVKPWGVDASSGLERSPGHKDHGMVAAFIAKAKRT